MKYVPLFKCACLSRQICYGLKNNLYRRLRLGRRACDRPRPINKEMTLSDSHDESVELRVAGNQDVAVSTAAQA